jgi:FixJ family two-component response regulator
MDAISPLVAVVDDDASVGRAIRRLLRSTGLAADIFQTGDDFLQRCAATPPYRPACVVLDVQMPGLNGLEVQQRLAGSSIPVIFITAREEGELREQALAAGASAYLRKPFNDEVLIEAVRRAIDPR